MHKQLLSKRRQPLSKHIQSLSKPQAAVEQAVFTLSIRYERSPRESDSTLAVHTCSRCASIST